MIKISINTKRITRPSRKTAKGEYRDFVLFDKPDDYGNDGFVKEDVSREEREQGIQGAIVGNWRDLSKGKQAPKAKPAQTHSEDEDDIDF